MDRSHHTKNLHGWERIALACLCGFGAVVLFIVTNPYGIGITTDSVTYLSVARNITDGFGVIDYRGNPLVDWLPLYPVLLSLFSTLTAIDAVVWARHVNIILFFGSIYLSGLLLLRHIRTRILAFLAMISLLITVPVIQVSLMAWSEPLFIFLVVLFLYSLTEFIAEQKTSAFVGFTLAAAFACLTRYIGIALVATGVFAMMVTIEGRWLKAKRGGVFLAITCAPSILWVARNYVVSGSLSGERIASGYSIVDNLSAVLETALSWYLPDRIITMPLLIIVTLLIFGLIVGLSIKTMVGRKQGIEPLILVNTMFMVIYILILVISASVTHYEKIGDRYLSPIAISLTLVFIQLIDQLIIRVQRLPYGRYLLVPIFGIVILTLVAPLNTTSVNLIRFHSQGSGYSGRDWRESEGIRYVEQLYRDENHVSIMSNAPDAVYIITGHTTLNSPSRTNTDLVTEDERQVSEYFQHEGITNFLWFDAVNRPYLIAPHELSKIISMNLEKRFNDATLYSISWY